MKHLPAFWLLTAIIFIFKTNAQTTDLYIQYDLDKMESYTGGTNARPPLSNFLENGYSTSRAFYDIMLIQEGNDYFEGTSCAASDKRVVNPDFKTNFDLLKPTTNVLRFPGGELANFYHFGQYKPGSCFTNNVGYGIKDEEVISRKNINTFVREKIEQLRTDRNAIFDLVELCKQYPDIEVVYVMNMATHFINWRDSVLSNWYYYYRGFDNWEHIVADADFNKKMQENLNAVRLLRSHGIKIRGIELGNEMFMNDYPFNLSISRTLTEKDEYIVKFNNLMKIYSDSIRANFPGVPIGIPFSDRNNAWERTWNAALLANSAKFDAIVDHDYYNGTETYTPREYCKTKLEEKITLLELVAKPYGKKIWITEWNMGYDDPAVINTIQNASYIMDYVTAIKDINSRHGDIVEIMTLHNLAATSSTYPLLNARGNYFGANAPFVKPNSSVWGAYMINLFDYLVSSTQKWSAFNDIVYNAVDSVNKPIDKNKVFFKTFYQPEGQVNGIMYFANTSNQTYKLSKKNSYLLTGGQRKNFTAMDQQTGRVATGYNVFYIDSMGTHTIVSRNYIETDTALIPANSMGIIVTTYLTDGNSTNRIAECNITQNGLSLDDIRNNMADIWNLLCDNSAVAERKAPEAAVIEEPSAPVRAFPNPANGFVRFDNSAEGSTIQLFNQVGVLVYVDQNASKNAGLDVSKLPAGMYHYKITGSAGQQGGHFVVQH